MLRIFATFLLFATFMVPLAVSANVTKGLIGHWKFDENVGTTTADASAGGNAAMLIGDPAWVPGAIAGSAVAFNGTTQYGILATSTSSTFNMGAGDFTVAAWVKINANAGSYNTFVAKNLGGSCCAPLGYPGYLLGEQKGKIVFRLESDAEGLDPVEVSISSTPYRGFWHHFAGVRQGDYVKLYIDGILIATSTLAGHYTRSEPFKIDTNYPLAIGAVSYWRMAYPIAGSIDDVRIYNRGLSVGEIASIARSKKQMVFPVFDAMGLVGKPDLRPEGFTRISADGGLLITSTEEVVRKWARNAPRGQYYFIDIEPETGGYTDAIIDHLISVLQWTKDENPDLQIGMYGVAPPGNYYAPLLFDRDPRNPTYRGYYNEWEQRSVQLRRLAPYVDFVTVSLYTLFDVLNDKNAWRVFARENIGMAFQYRKPIFVFMWSRYNPTGGGQYKFKPKENIFPPLVPIDYWREQLDYVRESGVDGIVLWDSATISPPWDFSAPWFIKTKEFLSSLQSEQVPSRTYAPLGQRVTVSTDVAVYATASDATVNAQQSAGVGGWVFGGSEIPHPANGGATVVKRWRVDFDIGPDGWVDESVLMPDVTQGLLAHWDYEEATGSAQDVTKRNNTARAVNAPGRTSGKIGVRAAKFDGSRSYFNAGDQDDFNFNYGNFTIATWAKLEAGSDAHNVFVAKNIAVPRYPGYLLGERYRRIVFQVQSTDNSAPTTIIATSSALLKGDWHHYTGVRDGNDIRLYVDGVLVASSTFSGSVSNSISFMHGRPLTLGAAFGSILEQPLNGALDDTRIYNIALGTEDIKRLAGVASPTPTPPVPPTPAPSGGGGGGGGGGSYVPFVSSVAPPAAPAQSSSLSATQRQSLIAELLAKVLELQKKIIALGGTLIAIPAGLSGGAASSTATGLSSFTRNLKRGDRGEDVRALQRFLNTHGFAVTASGDGSSGKETTYFGSGTVSALIRFQNAYKSDILAPAGLTKGTGFFGALTRKIVEEIRAQ
ncbi:MAG: LamG-like jellyroll fold domain-containing protein [Patescibacteria group bacterium]